MGRQAVVGLEPVYTPEQIADFLNVSVETARRKLREREIPGFKIGRGWRVFKSVFDAYVQDLVNATPEPDAA